MRVRASDLTKTLVKVHAGVSAAIHVCRVVSAAPRFSDPRETIRSMSISSDLLLTRATGSVVCFLHSKMGGARHKAVERLLLQGSVAELGMLPVFF